MSDLNPISVVPGEGTLFQEKKPVAPSVFKGSENRLTRSKQSVGKLGPINAPDILQPKTPIAAYSSLQSQVTLWNKFLNDSGQPNRFRVDPNSDNKMIQEINPATDEVIGEYSVGAFPALAKSLGLLGSLVNRRA